MVNGRRDVSEASPLVEDFLTCILLWPLFQTIVSFVENLYILVFKWVSFCLLNENKLLLMCSSCAGTSSSGLAVEYIQWAFFTTLDCINYIASFSFGCSVFGVNQLLPQCVASFEISLFLVFLRKILLRFFLRHRQGFSYFPESLPLYTSWCEMLPRWKPIWDFHRCLKSTWEECLPFFWLLLRKLEKLHQ